KKRSYRLEFEQMDKRWTADDFIGAARLPLFGGGLAIFGSMLVNPATFLGGSSQATEPAATPPGGGDLLLGKPESYTAAASLPNYRYEDPTLPAGGFRHDATPDNDVPENKIFTSMDQAYDLGAGHELALGQYDVAPGLGKGTAPVPPSAPAI